MFIMYYLLTDMLHKALLWIVDEMWENIYNFEVYKYL